MKIDTSKIEGYADMTPEQKLAAIEGYNFDMSGYVPKTVFDKTAAEASEWKKKHKALLTDEEQKKQEDADRLAAMESELNTLRKAKTVSEYTAKLVEQGYDGELATKTATAMADGDMAKVFACQKTFLDGYAKTVRADSLKQTPRPPAGGAGDVNYAQLMEQASANGDAAALAYYTRLNAMQEADNS